MGKYVAQGVMLRDGSAIYPVWLRRVVVWQADDWFLVDCGAVPLPIAAEILLAAIGHVQDQIGGAK